MSNTHFAFDARTQANKRRLNFDFDAIAVLGLRFDLPRGGAAKIGASTGLGAEKNVQLSKQACLSPNSKDGAAE